MVSACLITPKNVSRFFSPAAVFALVLMLGSPVAMAKSNVDQGQVVTVATGILPLGYLAESLLPEEVNVNVLVPKGFSPATYEPSMSQMKNLHQADMYFAVMVPFEKQWQKKLLHNNPGMQWVDVGDGLRQPMLATIEHHEEAHHYDHDDHESGHGHHHDAHDDHHETHHEEEHHDDDHHDHSGEDPHVWLSPTLTIQIIERMADALSKQYPQWQETISRNQHDLIAQFQILDKRFTELTQSLPHAILLTFHPSWGYLANDYQWQQLSIEVDGKNPTPRQLRSTIEAAKEHQVKFVITSPAFSSKAANQVANTLNVPLITLSPLTPYPANLQMMIDQLHKYYQP